MIIQESNMNLKDTDYWRKYQSMMLVGASSSVFLVAFAINALINSRSTLGAFLFGITVLVLASMYAMHQTNNYKFGVKGFAAAVFITYIYLMASGGVYNTGPFWCYPLILIVVLILGFHKGVLALLALFAISATILFFPELPFVSANYPETFTIRFLASILALGVIASIYEYSRWVSQERYIAISETLDKNSRTDTLTGLANRRDIQERLEAESGIYNRHGNPFSIIMVDLDNFKLINDHYGHATGDKLLIAISDLFVSEVRRQDVVSRWGGEEFLILLPQTSHTQAMEVAEKLRLAVENNNFPSTEIKNGMTISLGVQSIKNTDNVSELIKDSDRMLYEAKRNGKNQVVGFILEKINFSP